MRVDRVISRLIVFVLAACLTAVAGCRPATDAEPPFLATRPATATAAAEFVFIHAGDPQIGGFVDIEKGRRNLEELARAANQLRPAFVVIVGDLVNDGPHQRELDAFELARKKFEVPVYLIPGNHDSLSEFHKRYGRDYYSFRHGGCEFVFINSQL